MSMAHEKRPPPDPPKFNVERPRVKSFRNSLNCFPSGKTPGAPLPQRLLWQQWKIDGIDPSPPVLKK